jgi:hypothetical protein
MNADTFQVDSALSTCSTSPRPRQRWQEYKEGIKPYGHWFVPALRIIDGAMTVPKGAGVGIAAPKEILQGAEVVA